MENEQIQNNLTHWENGMGTGENMGLFICCWGVLLSWSILPLLHTARPFSHFFPVNTALTSRSEKTNDLVSKYLIMENHLPAKVWYCPAARSEKSKCFGDLNIISNFTHQPFLRCAFHQVAPPAPLLPVCFHLNSWLRWPLQFPRTSRPWLSAHHLKIYGESNKFRKPQSPNLTFRWRRNLLFICCRRLHCWSHCCCCCWWSLHWCCSLNCRSKSGRHLDERWLAARLSWWLHEENRRCASWLRWWDCNELLRLGHHWLYLHRWLLGSGRRSLLFDWRLPCWLGSLWLFRFGQWLLFWLKK